MIKTIKKSTICIITILFSLALLLAFCSCSKAEKSHYTKDNFKQTDTVEIDVKDYGTIEVGLDANSAPKTVENFKKLVEQGFYNGLTFHRIMKDFMAQGGDPKGDGTGGSQENVKGEFVTNGVKNYLPHLRGAISMARSSDNNSASSQFFIVHQTSDKNSSALDSKYACFGYVLSGMEVVDKICEDAKPTDDNGTIEKSKQPVINSIKLK